MTRCFGKRYQPPNTPFVGQSSGSQYRPVCARLGEHDETVRCPDIEGELAGQGATGGIMIYPFWDEPVGYGILMAIIAVLHVFVSHFAIGGGLYLVVTERRATKPATRRRWNFWCV